jgi:hypothetical protein
VELRERSLVDRHARLVIAGAAVVAALTALAVWLADVGLREATRVPPGGGERSAAEVVERAAVATLESRKGAREGEAEAPPAVEKPIRMHEAAPAGPLVRRDGSGRPVLEATIAEDDPDDRRVADVDVSSSTREEPDSRALQPLKIRP